MSDRPGPHTVSDRFRSPPKIKQPTAAAQAQKGWVRSQKPTEFADNRKPAAANVVMHQFARGEVRNINRGYHDVTKVGSQADQNFMAMVERLRQMPEFANMSESVMRGTIQNITMALQCSDLTINFQPANFFRQENTSTTYQQMYDRAQVPVLQADGKTKLEMFLKDTPGNDAATREAADHHVTFAPRISDWSNKRVYDSFEGIRRFMMTGGLDRTGAAANTLFNPKARQQFAALNFKRSANGAVPFWGYSHFILRGSLKTNAIYYYGDTFGSVGVNDRATYGTLLSLVVRLDDDKLDDIIDCCFRRIRKDEYGLNLDAYIEVHIFEQISFRRDVKEMRIFLSELEGAARQNLAPGQEGSADALKQAKQTVWENAEKFAERNNITMKLVDDSDQYS